MASLTSNQATLAPVTNHPLSGMITRIEPPRGWFELRLKELLDYRELLYFLVWRSVKVRYKQTAIGVVWVVVQPLLTVVTFSLFFGKLAKLPSEGLPYPVFYFAAAVPWMYFSTALTKTTNVVVENQYVITKVYFPRLVLPMSSVLSGLVDFGIVFMVLVIFTLSYGFRPGLGVLLLPILLLIAVLTALGVGLWLSVLNALYRDVSYVIPFVVQFWMFASPVAYSSSLVPEKWRWLYGLNPMAVVIDGFRWALTGHGLPPGPTILASSAIVGIVLLGGFFFFNRIEGTVADRV